MSLRLLILALLLGLTACATQDHALEHQRLRQGTMQTLPGRILFVEPDVRVSEISAGGVVEEVPDWSRMANGHLRAALAGISRELNLTVLPLPALPAAEQEVLAQHVALYDLVAGSAFQVGGLTEPAWEHKKKMFDYTLGPGLAFLAPSTGADAALFIVGADFISSSGRKAAMVVGALFGVVIPTGFSYLTAGVVDLKTGDLLWLNYQVAQTTDLRQASDADKLLRQVFASYPGMRTGRAASE